MRSSPHSVAVAAQNNADAAVFAVALALAAAGCARASTASENTGSETAPSATARAASALSAPSPGATGPAPSGVAPTGPAASDAPGAVSPALEHPCKLLDYATVKAALGTSDFATQETPGKAPNGNAECSWHVPKGGGFVEVSLQYVPDTVEHFVHLYHLMNETEFPGLGDKAFVNPKMKWGHVDVLVHGQKVMVQLSRGNIATGMTATQNTMQDTTLALARKVVAQL